MTKTQQETGIIIEDLEIKQRIPKLEKVSVRKRISSFEVLYASDDNKKVKGIDCGLFYAVDECFRNHYSLALSPDVIWFTILEQVSIYIKQNSEKYRDWFTDSKEQKKITVFDNMLAEDIYEKKDWNKILPVFRKKLTKELGEEKMRCLLPNFSIEREESEMTLIIAMMDSVSTYYSFGMYTFCGIPKIHLQGTCEDWESMKSALKGLGILSGLQFYFQKVNTILDKFIDSFHQNIDLGFFRSIYKQNNESGGPYITGWLTDLFAFNRNELKKEEDYIPWNGGGFHHSKWSTVGNFPTNVCKANFTWEFPDKEYNMTFLGGIFYSELDNDFITPRLNYAVGIANPEKKKT